MSHSPEPWGYKTNAKNCHETAEFFACADAGSGGEMSVVSCWVGHCPDEDKTVAGWHVSADDAARIVACVNFCRGFPTEFLVGKQLIAGEVRTIEVDQ